MHILNKTNTLIVWPHRSASYLLRKWNNDKYHYTCCLFVCLFISLYLPLMVDYCSCCSPLFRCLLFSGLQKKDHRSLGFFFFFLFLPSFLFAQVAQQTLDALGAHRLNVCVCVPDQIELLRLFKRILQPQNLHTIMTSYASDTINSAGRPQNRITFLPAHCVAKFASPSLSVGTQWFAPLAPLTDELMITTQRTNASFFCSSLHQSSNRLLAQNAGANTQQLERPANAFNVSGTIVVTFASTEPEAIKSDVTTTTSVCIITCWHECSSNESRMRALLKLALTKRFN